MASEGVLRTEDIIEKGIFKDAIEGGKALEQQIKSIYAVIENKGAASQNFLSTFIPKNLGDIQKANAEMAKSNTLIDSKIKLSEAEAKIVALQAKAEAEQAKARRENEKVSQEELKTKILNTKETERQERATKKLSGAYFEAKKALNEISNEIKNEIFLENNLNFENEKNIFLENEKNEKNIFLENEKNEKNIFLENEKNEKNIFLKNKKNEKNIFLEIGRAHV
mgnify:CR=1 FL=1